MKIDDSKSRRLTHCSTHTSTNTTSISTSSTSSSISSSQGRGLIWIDDDLSALPRNYSKLSEYNGLRNKKFYSVFDRFLRTRGTFVVYLRRKGRRSRSTNDEEILYEEWKD